MRQKRTSRSRLSDQGSSSSSDLIVNVRFSAAPTRLVASGLLGWVSVTFAGVLSLDGIGIRRTRAGRLVLSFPSRRDSRGTRHPFIRPANNRARKFLEASVFRALGLLARGEELS